MTRIETHEAGLSTTEMIEQLPSEEHESDFIYTRAFDGSQSFIERTEENLGGKGMSLAVMTQLGLPVPEGFTITTTLHQHMIKGELDALPDEAYREVEEQIHRIHEKLHRPGGTHRTFGLRENPLILSVRSGAAVSMPGKLHTFLNVGINDETIKGLKDRIGEAAAYGSYYKLMKALGINVFGIEEEAFTSIEKSIRQQMKDDDHYRDWSALNDAYLPTSKKKRMESFYPYFRRLLVEADSLYANSGETFPQDVHEQLRLAIHGVYGSWHSEEAIAHRQANSIPDDLGTAVNIQEMMFGNANTDRGISGSGVGFSIHPGLGERFDGGKGPVISFVEGEQGSAVVSDKRTHDLEPISKLSTMPYMLQKKLQGVFELLLELQHPQDIEFTIENDELVILQTRDVKVTPIAYFLHVLNLSQRGKTATADIPRRILPPQLRSLLEGNLDPVEVERADEHDRFLGDGHIINPGIAIGTAVTTIEEARQTEEEVIFIGDISSSDVGRLPDNVIGIIALHAGTSSHLSQDIRATGFAGNETGNGQNIPIVFGVKLNGKVDALHGETITLDGHYGRVFHGSIALEEDGTNPHLRAVEVLAIKKWLEELDANPWSYTTSHRHLRTYTDVARAAFDEVKSVFAAPKAREHIVLNAAFPPEFIMQYTPVDPTDSLFIREYLESAVEHKGIDASVRTAFPAGNEGSAPYAWLKTEDDVRRFMTNKHYYYVNDHGKRRRYHSYQHLLRLKPDSLLLGMFPEDKLSKDEHVMKQHFAGSVTVMSDAEVVLQLSPETPFTRSMDEDEFADSVIEFTTRFSHSAENGLRAHEIRTDASTIDEQILKRAHEIADYFFDEIWRQYDIPERMAAISEVFKNIPAAALEFQVRFDQDTGEMLYLMVYGIKTV